MGRTSQGDLWKVDRHTLEHYGSPDLEVSPEKIALWSLAFFYAGNFLRLWNEAVEIKMALLTAGSFNEGQNVVLIGKYADDSGITSAIRSLTGENGTLKLFEVGPQFLKGFKYVEGVEGKWPKWDFDYSRDLPAASVDRIVFFGTPSHISDWQKLAKEVDRVLKPSGRIIFADINLGKDLLTPAYLDTHLEGIITKLLSGMKLYESDLPDVGPDRLKIILYLKAV